MWRIPIWNGTHFLGIFTVCLLKWMCDWDSDQLSPPKALSQKIGWTAINAKMDAFRQKIDTQGPPIGTLSRCPPIILQFGKEFCLFVWTIFLQVMCKWMIKFYYVSFFLITSFLIIGWKLQIILLLEMLIWELVLSRYSFSKVKASKNASW